MGAHGSVPVGPLREAYFRAVASGVVATVIAEEMGWWKKSRSSRSGRCGDHSRLLRMLGLRHDCATGGPLDKCVSYDVAVLFTRAVDRAGYRLDPHEVGV